MVDLSSKENERLISEEEEREEEDNKKEKKDTVSCEQLGDLCVTPT